MTKVKRKSEYVRIMALGNPISKEDKKFMWSEFDEYYYDLVWLAKHKGLKIGKHPTFDNTCFFIKNKTTKEWVGIGTNKLLSANPIRDRVTNVLRNLVQPQIENFRIENNGQGMHVDHIKPFWRLVKKWLIKIKADSLEELEPLITEKGDEFMSNEMNKDWKKYHLKKAKLQILSKTENLSKGGR